MGPLTSEQLMSPDGAAGTGAAESSSSLPPPLGLGVEAGYIRLRPNEDVPEKNLHRRVRSET